MRILSNKRTIRLKSVYQIRMWNLKRYPTIKEDKDNQTTKKDIFWIIHEMYQAYIKYSK